MLEIEFFKNEPSRFCLSSARLGSFAALFVSALSEPLNNVTQLYSVSLGLVTHALDRNLKRNKSKTGGSRGGFPTLEHPVREPLETLIKVNNF
jgi:hypothetical protein